MCQIFIRTNPDLYRLRSRSLRLRGVATSIRLENLFWEVLEEIGRRDNLSVPQLIARLYDELMAAAETPLACEEQSSNFSSFLRVCCGRYLSLQASGAIPIDVQIPIASLDPVRVLASERHCPLTTHRPVALPQTSPQR